MTSEFKKEPILLHLETATEVCSVALSRGEVLLGKKEDSSGYAHAEKLFPFIEEVVQSAGLTPQQLDGVVVSSGPGSYTGLRIGASAAKGLAYSLDIPLIAISTLQSLFEASKFRHNNANFLYAPMIDARRMEVYTAFYQHNGTINAEPIAAIVDEHYGEDILKETTIVFSGNGASKLQTLLEGKPNAVFDLTPLSAENLMIPALTKFHNKEFEDMAYFEPFYLKEYVAVKSKVKGLYK